MATGSWDNGGININSGDTYAIDNTNFVTGTSLGNTDVATIDLADDGDIRWNNDDDTVICGSNANGIDYFVPATKKHQFRVNTSIEVTLDADGVTLKSGGKFIIDTSEVVTDAAIGNTNISSFIMANGGDIKWNNNTSTKITGNDGSGINIDVDTGDTAAMRVNGVTQLSVNGAKTIVNGVLNAANLASNTGTVVEILANGDFVESTSSRRFKSNIESLSDVDLINFDKIRPVKYNRNNQSKELFGFIAEELNEIYPQYVNLDKHDMPYSVRYGEMTSLLVKKCQKYQEYIELLHDRVTKLEEKLGM